MSTPIYYQFPLYALAVGGDAGERMTTLICYCCMQRGYNEVRDNPRAAEAIDVPSLHKSRPCSYRAWKIGCDKLEIVNLDTSLADEKYVTLLEACRGHENPFVRIRKDWFWNCVHTTRGAPAEKPLSYTEFTVLCALLSKIGTKKRASCTWKEIQRRALGYTTEAQLKARIWSREDKAKPLTRQQIRTILDRLETNKFFARFVAHAGKAPVRSHYSFSMERSKLAVEVATEFGQRRTLLIKARRQKDQQISVAHAIIERRKSQAKALLDMPTNIPPPGNQLPPTSGSACPPPGNHVKRRP